MAKKKPEPANDAESLKSAVLARMDEPGGKPTYGALPGLDFIKGAVVQFLVEKVLAEAGDAIGENRDAAIVYVSEKAGDLTALAIDGAEKLIEQLRESLGGL